MERWRITRCLKIGSGSEGVRWSAQKITDDGSRACYVALSEKTDTINRNRLFGWMRRKAERQLRCCWALFWLLLVGCARFLRMNELYNFAHFFCSSKDCSHSLLILQSRTYWCMQYVLRIQSFPFISKGFLFPGERAASFVSYQKSSL